MLAGSSFLQSRLHMFQNQHYVKWNIPAVAVEIPNNVWYYKLSKENKAAKPTGNSSVNPNYKAKGVFHMKKFLSLTVCILILSLLFTGCGSLSPKKLFSNELTQGRKSEESGEPVMLTGQVENDVVDGWNANVFVLDTPIVGTETITIDFTAEMLYGTHCKDWTIYARTQDGWQVVGNLQLPGGNGSTTKTLNLAKVGNLNAFTYIDAIVVQPQASGSYSWNWQIGIYAVRQTSTQQRPAEKPAKATEAPSILDTVSGQWEHDVVNGWSTNVFALDTTIKGCESMTIYFNADMQYGARCKDWTLYARSNGVWNEIGSLYLPGGTGEATETLNMDGTMYIDAICIEPTARGSYSWSMSIGIYDVQARYN